MEEKDQVSEAENTVGEKVNSSEVENQAKQEEVKTGEVVNGGGFTQEDMEKNKLMAVLCYCSILVLIPYLTEKKSEWVKHHAIQGINIFIIEVAGYILKLFPIIGGVAFTVCGIFALVISLIGIVNVLNEEDKPLPLIDKIKFIKK